MVKSLNSQMNAELYSAYLYLSMEAYFESNDLSGFANWMRVQAQEEMTHAMKFYDYLVQRGARVTLTEIKSPPTEWDSPVATFEHVYEHEQMVTTLINQLVDLAISLSLIMQLTISYNGMLLNKWRRRNQVVECFRKLN